MASTRVFCIQSAGLARHGSARSIPRSIFAPPHAQLRSALRRAHIPPPQPQLFRRYASEASQILGEAATATEPPPPQRSLLRRILTLVALGVFATTAGFAISASPAISSVNQMLTVATDAETLKLYTAPDERTAAINTALVNHPVAQALRADPNYIEGRPHLKIPAEMRTHNLTAGTLAGPGRVAVPPLVFSERNGEDITILAYVGKDVCGHPGVVHGGLIATLIDEGFARCCFAKLPNQIGMTANLNINYRRPLPADTYICLKAKTVGAEGRKAWVEGSLEELVKPGEKGAVYCEGSALFVEPRQAATMKRIYPVAQ